MVHSAFYDTIFNDNPDFVKTAIFSHEKSAFGPPAKGVISPTAKSVDFTAARFHYCFFYVLCDMINRRCFLWPGANLPRFCRNTSRFYFTGKQKSFLRYNNPGKRRRKAPAMLKHRGKNIGFAPGTSNRRFRKANNALRSADAGGVLSGISHEQKKPGIHHSGGRAFRRGASVADRRQRCRHLTEDGVGHCDRVLSKHETVTERG